MMLKREIRILPKSSLASFLIYSSPWNMGCLFGYKKGKPVWKNLSSEFYSQISAQNYTALTNLRSMGRFVPTLKAFCKPGPTQMFLNRESTAIICPLSGPRTGKLFFKEPENKYFQFYRPFCCNSAIRAKAAVDNKPMGTAAFQKNFIYTNSSGLDFTESMVWRRL